MIDVNLFNRYHTFQIDGGNKNTLYTSQSSVQMRFKAPKSSLDDGDSGLLFRMRAELSSADSGDQVQQGMRVSLVNENDGIIVDGTSIDNDEGTVLLSFDSLVEDKEYIIRYDLYDREISAGASDTLNGGNTHGIKCRLPFITQQLMIIDKRLVQHRVGQYAASKKEEKYIDLQKDGLHCDFEGLKQNSTLFNMFEIEAEVYCAMQNYHFRTSTDSQSIVKIYEKDFEIVPLLRFNVTSITYHFDLQLGFNFLASPGIKVLLTRGDSNFTIDDPFSCLSAKTCVIARITQKNMLRLSLLLTSGKYKLIFLEDVKALPDNEMVDIKTKSLRLQLTQLDKPISVKIQANNVVQNEERVNCPYMYLEKDFLQNKFVEGMRGQKFTFSDTLVLNILNQSQSFVITPEVDSVVKLRSKEAQGGVNVEIKMYQYNGKELEELGTSSQKGIYEVFGNSSLKKGTRYLFIISFHNSLIQLSTDQSCPSYHFEFSMMSKEEEQRIEKEHSKVTDTKDFQSETKLTKIFNDIDQIPAMQSYSFKNPETIFTFDAPADGVIASKLFHVQYHKVQLAIEIFYEPYLSYDLALTLTSKDVKNSRSHIGKTQKTHPLYQSTKSLFVELEPGEYEFSILYMEVGGLQKLGSVQFQLQLSFAKDLQEQLLMPQSLNYFGLLGPNGTDFGQMVYFCEDCLLEKSQFTYIDFEVAADNNVNFDAVVVSPQDVFDIRLEVVDKNEEKKQQNEIKKGKEVGKRMSRDRTQQQGQAMKTITASSLIPKTKYRLVLILKNTAQDISDALGYRFTLRIEIQSEQRQQTLISKIKTSNVPKSFEEFTRFKKRTEGERESDFLLITSKALAFIDGNKLSPFASKGEVYQVVASTEVIHAVEFEIKEEESLIYGSVLDYSQGQEGTKDDVMGQGIGIRIRNNQKNEEDQDIVVQSIPAKYFNYIPSTTLAKGNYLLEIFHSSFSSSSSNTQKQYRFSLNFLVEREDTSQGFSMQLLEHSVQLCTPSPPLQLPRTLNTPYLMHPLSGSSSFSALLEVSASDVLSTGTFMVTIPNSPQSQQQLMLLSVYLESESSRFEVRIHQGYQLSPESAIATGKYSQLNEVNENFIKQNRLKKQNIVQIRNAQIEPGHSYRVVFEGIEGDQEILKNIGRCDKMKMHISIAPVHEQLKKCQQAGALEKQLKFGEDSNGKLFYSTFKPIFDTTYLQTNTMVGKSAPYLFYFQMTFDSQIDGPLGLVLYKYDAETLTFNEFEAFALADQSSQILTRIDDEGTYVLALEGFQSSSDKYEGANASLVERCVEVQYNYYIGSLEKDWRTQNIAKELIQMIPNQNECNIDQIPLSFPNIDEGYDLTYNLPFRNEETEVIDIHVAPGTEARLFKIMLRNYDNPLNNLMGYLYKNLTFLQPPGPKADDALSRTVRIFDEKVLSIILTPKKRPYKLKLVYDSVQKLGIDSCQTYTLRAASMGLSQIMNETLVCKNRQAVPNLIKVEGDVYNFEQDFELTTEQLIKQGIHKNEKGQSIFKDVTIEIPITTPQKGQEYYFDLELSHDFLTADIEATLFMIAQDNKRIHLGDTSVSRPCNNHPEEKNVGVTTKTFKRTKLDNIRDQLDVELTDSYLLVIEVSKMTVSFANAIIAQGVSSNPVCFPFSLSLRVSKPLFDEVEYEKETDPTENELVRVQWEATKQSSTSDDREIFNPEDKLQAILEFKESVKQQFQNIKFETIIYLQSLENAEEKHYPDNMKMQPDEKSSVFISFAHKTLKYGQCYKLQLSENTQMTTRIKSLEKSAKIVCATKCESCNKHGSEGCNEETGQCICRPNYDGPKCDLCVKGYSLDNGQCKPLLQCKSQSSGNGTVDCNNHGTCYQDEQNGFIAKCRCDPGFEDDGDELCGKCQDSMFTYPNCQQRYWMITHNKYNCQEMKSSMPTYLYKNDSFKQEKVYQNQEGQLFWNEMYRLDTFKPEKQSGQTFKTAHYFEISGDSSMLRVFYDTHHSKVEAKFRILTAQDLQVIYDSNTMVVSFAKVIRLQIPDTQVSSLQTLIIEFEYSESVPDKDKVKQSCPMIEILMIMQPFNKIKNYLKCSDEQLTKVSKNIFSLVQIPMQSQPSKSQQSFVVSSEQAAQSDDQYFLFIKQNLTIKDSSVKHAISALSSYNFESMYLYMHVRDIQTGNIVAVQTFSYIEDVEADQNGIYGNLANQDMLSYIEIVDIPVGTYELVISIDKALFMPPTTSYPTCLTFDLNLEHVPMQTDSQNLYQVVGILPEQIEHLQASSLLKIELKFNKDLVFSELMPKTSDQIERLCRLETDDGQNVLIAKKAILNGRSAVEFYFDFKNALHFLDSSETERCYQVKCPHPQSSSTSLFNSDEDQEVATAAPKAFIGEIKIQNRYCLQSENLEQVKCNPNSFAKIIDNKCNCSLPYRGPNCQECESGYLKSLDQQKNTVCSVDLTKCSNLFCNNLGQCSMKNNQPLCQCYNSKRYSGIRCEQCADSSLAYPDCTQKESEVYDSNVTPPTSLMVNQNGYESFQGSKEWLSEEKCFFSNYPKDLDALSFGDFLPKTKDFHFAEYYTASHDHDNQIKFTPFNVGVFKILIQQPEDEDLTVNKDSYDIEIGIYHQDSQKFVATASNSQIAINGIQKLETTQLTWEVPEDMLGQKMIVMFKAVNFTDMNILNKEEGVDRCLSLYIEIQYSSYKDKDKNILQTSCQLDPDTKTILPFTETPITISSSHAYSLSPLEASYLITSSSHQFLAFQDFTFSDLDSNSTDFALHVSLFQDFLDPISVDLIFEVLSFDGDEEQVASPAAVADPLPKCEKMCLAGAQKAYNEFHNVIEVSSGTKLRLWLYKLGDKGCGKIQIQINAKTQLRQNLVAGVMRCQERMLPQSLNTDEFIGVNGDRGFHIKDRFRVESVNGTSHSIKFDLKESMMMRVVGIQHKHIEFDIELVQHLNNSSSRRIIDSGAKDFEDSIFAQLDSGSYSIKLIFVSEAFFMNQPCQSVEIELAFDTTNNLKHQIPTIYQGEPYQNLSQLLQNVKKDQSIFSFTKKNMIKNFNIQDQNVKTTYKSFIEVETASFKISDTQRNGIIIELYSEFLRNDVSFALTTLSSKRSLGHQRTMLGKRLVLEELTPGEYEFTIYLHQSLSNFETQITSLDVSFSIGLSFISVQEKDDFREHHMQLKLRNSQPVSTLISTVLPSEFESMSKYSFLPGQISQPFFGTFVLDKYKVSFEFPNLARVIVDESNFRLAFDTMKKGSIPINMDQQQVLYLERSSQVLFENERQESSFVGVPVSVGFFKDHNCQRNVNQKIEGAIEIKPEESKRLTIGIPNDKAVTHELTITDYNSEILISVDISHNYFLPEVKLFALEMSKGVDQTEIEPSDVYLSSQSRITYVFNSLPKKTMMAVYQPQKDSNCGNNVPIEISATMLQQSAQSAKVLISHEEIKSLNRYVEPLPVTLDTYKYLKNDRDYVLISEYLKMDSDNKITFTLQKEEDTYFKIILEATDIYMTLKDKHLRQLARSTSNILESVLPKGQYEVHFEFSTIHSSSQNLASLKNAFHLTIVVADKTFVNKVYVKENQIAFKNCDSIKNFPLALNKRNDQSQVKDEMIYDFEFLRISGTVLQERTEIDKYAFRINNTSRFYLNLGIKQLHNNANLRLVELKESGGASYFGKYEFNLNSIDYIIGPGDYALYIEQPQSQSLNEFMKISSLKPNEICGLFSLTGKITPMLANLQDGIPQASQLQQSRCLIKNVLPNKIHKSQADTKDGGEHFINSDGEYTKLFIDLLVKKARDLDDPESDTLQIDVPNEDSILAIMIQHARHHLSDIRVKLSNSFNQPNQIYTMQRIVGNGIVEQTYLFSLTKSTQYLLDLTYTGEVDESCDYFNLQMSIVTDSLIRDQLSCYPDANIENLMDGRVIPQEMPINQEIKSNLVVRYPDDYERYGKISDNHKCMLTKEISVRGKDYDNLLLEAEVSFDFPFSSFNLHLNEERTDSMKFEEDAAAQMPLQLAYGSSNEFIRELSSPIEHGIKYKFSISDTLSWHLMNYTYTKTKNPLCLFVNVKLSLNGTSSKAIFGKPTILSISPSSMSYLTAPPPTELRVTLQFSSLPYSSIHGEVSGELKDLGQVFTLKLQTPQGILKETLTPAKIQVKESTLTFIYALPKLKTETDILFDVKVAYLSDKNGVQFTIPSDMQQNSWRYDAEGLTPQGDLASQIRTTIKQPRRTAVRLGQMTKCQCEHGTCIKGETKCNKCDEGWSGRMCDNKVRQKKETNMPQRKESNIQSTKTNEERINKAQIQIEENPPQQDEDTSIIFTGVIYVMTLGLICFTVYIVVKSRMSIRDYIPVSFSDDGDDDGNQHNNTSVMELTEIKSRGEKQVSKNTAQLPMNTQTLNQLHQIQVIPQNIQGDEHHVLKEDQEFEIQTAQLTKELQLFSEADQNQLYEYYPEQQQQTSEIDDVLREMEEQFDENDGDNDNEYGRFI